MGSSSINRSSKRTPRGSLQWGETGTRFERRDSSRDLNSIRPDSSTSTGKCHNSMSSNSHLGNSLNRNTDRKRKETSLSRPSSSSVLRNINTVSRWHSKGTQHRSLNQYHTNCNNKRCTPANFVHPMNPRCGYSLCPSTEKGYQEAY